MSNLLTMSDIVRDPAALMKLTLPELDALLGRCDWEAKTAASARKCLYGEIERRYGDRIRGAYLHEHKDTGTVRLADDGYDIVCDKPKRVDWDQDKLIAAGDKMAHAGIDPSEIIDTDLSVSERRYSALPVTLRQLVDEARTVKAGAMTIKLFRQDGGR